MGLQLDIGANTRAAVRGMKDVEESIDRTAGALDDMARDGDRAGDKLERTFRDIVNDAKRADKAVENIGDKGKSGFGKAGEAASEFKDEALSNLSEVTSSFDGSMSSIQDLVQGTLGGLAGSLPGIGLLAAGAAAGVGLIGAAIESNDEKIALNKQAQAEWAQAFIDSNGLVLSSAVTTANALSIVTDPDKFQQAQTNAKNWGVDVGTAIAAAAGETWALTAAQESLAKRSAQADAALAQQERQVDENAGAAYDLADSTKAGAAAMSELTGNIAAGSAQADAYSQYLRNMARNTEGARETVDKFGDSVYDLPDGRQIYIDLETGQATVNADAIQSKVYGLKGAALPVTVKDETNNEMTKILARLGNHVVTVGVTPRLAQQRG